MIEFLTECLKYLAVGALIMLAWLLISFLGAGLFFALSALLDRLEKKKGTP